MIISRTPYRISFFGGGTDYPAYYRQNGGAVLAGTINRHCYITCRYLPPFLEHRIRLVYSHIEQCQHFEEIRHPVVREVIRMLAVDRGVEIHHDGDLPARAGMGSSSAFTVGLLNALNALCGRRISRRQLALDAIHIEQDVLKETVGSQDQMLAAYGGINHIIFQPSGEITVRPLSLLRSRVEQLASHLMLFFTGISRTASDVAQSYVADLDQKKKRLQRMLEMVEEGLAILHSDSDLVNFGHLLHEAWEAKRSLASTISTPQVEHLYEEARRGGALGGKLLGAGGGGFLLLFVPPSSAREVRTRLRHLIRVPIKFDFLGSQIIFFEPEEDYSAFDRCDLTPRQDMLDLPPLWGAETAPAGPQRRQ